MSSGSCPSVLPTATIFPTRNSHQRRASIARTRMRQMTFTRVPRTASVAFNDTQLRPALLGLHDRRLPLARQVFEGVGVEQRLVELAPLEVAHLGERRVADDLLDAAAQLGVRQWRRDTALV
jgi:hypothetical protein